jgi:hypothetical protein
MITVCGLIVDYGNNTGSIMAEYVLISAVGSASSRQGSDDPGGPITTFDLIEVTVVRLEQGTHCAVGTNTWSAAGCVYIARVAGGKR